MCLLLIIHDMYRKQTQLFFKYKNNGNSTQHTGRAGLKLGQSSNMQVTLWGQLGGASERSAGASL